MGQHTAPVFEADVLGHAKNFTLCEFFPRPEIVGSEIPEKDFGVACLQQDSVPPIIRGVGVADTDKMAGYGAQDRLFRGTQEIKAVVQTVAPWGMKTPIPGRVRSDLKGVCRTCPVVLHFSFSAF